MNKRVVLHFLLSLTLLIEHAAAQDLWNGSAAGMSLSEIKERFPSGLEKNEAGGIVEGEDLLYVLQGVEVMDETYKVGFYFQSEELVLVRLKAERLPVNATHKNQSRTRQILAILEEKYSSNPECEESLKQYNSISCEFITDAGLKITISYLDVGGSMPHRFIGYRYLGIPRSDNL